MGVVTKQQTKKSVTEDYQLTEEGMIPEDWEIQILGDSSTLSARIGWQGLTTDEYLENGKYYLVTGTDFEKGRIQWDKCYYVDYERFKQDKKIQLQKGDLLVTKDGTIGKVALVDSVPKPATLNSGIFVIRPREDKFDQSFFYYILSSKYFKKFLEQLSAGSTINHLYQRDIVKFKYPLPPTLEEQRAIAGALSDVDALIGELDAIIEKKQQIKKGAMQQLLTGKIRLPGFSGEWEEKKLVEVSDIINGGTPSTKKSEYWEGEIPWCTPTDITSTNGKYLSKTERQITELGLKNSSATLLPEGALLLCSRATVGEIKIAGSKITTNQGFKSLICSEQVDNKFLYYLIILKKQKFIDKAFGSTFLEISKKNTQEIEFQFPPLDEQKAIARILSDMDAEIQALQAKQEKYENIKQGMMQELLTGKTRLVKEEKAKAEAQSKPSHNWEFDEAVLISVLADCFGTKEFPLGRFRRTKYSYLVRRYLESNVDQFLKKAAGPYNPKTRYSGPENIALNNGYVTEWKNGKRIGFISDENIGQAWSYFENWYGQQAINWLEEGFRYAKNKELELLGTVDKARIELEKENRDVTLSNVKEVITSHPEWKPKLEREIFSDGNIERAIKESYELFG